MKILLADDSMTAQRMGVKILAEAGHEVVAVSNGAAAARKVLEFCPDAVVLDVYMPGYNGLELCELLKKTRETARIPVLLAVGKLEPFRAEEGTRVHADGVVIKPFEASELLRSIGGIMGEAVRDSGNVKRAGKSLAIPVLETPGPPVCPVEATLESLASMPASPKLPEAPPTSQVPGPAVPSIALGVGNESVAPIEEETSGSDGNPDLEPPPDLPLPPSAPAVFVVEPIEVTAADQESLAASAATLETQHSQEPSPQAPEESFTIALPTAATEPQAEPILDNPIEHACAEHEALSEAASAGDLIPPLVVDSTPANPAVPEGCGLSAIPAFVTTAAEEAPVFSLEEMPVPAESPIAGVEPSEVASGLVPCAPFAEVDHPVCQPAPALRIWEAEAEPSLSENGEAPAGESAPFPDDGSEAPASEATAAFVVEPAPAASAELYVIPLASRQESETAEIDVARERSVELATVAAIAGLVPNPVSAETSFVPLVVPTSAEEESMEPNATLPEDPSPDLEMAAPVATSPEADNIPAPEPASFAASPVLDQERIAAIVDAVLDRLKPQLVAEIVRELGTKA